jgi:hypothetical protein
MSSYNCSVQTHQALHSPGVFTELWGDTRAVPEGAVSPGCRDRTQRLEDGLCSYCDFA